MDGIWEAPTVDNPLCKIAPGCGQWTPPRIPNPAYKGRWSPPFIDNPNYRVCHLIFFFRQSQSFPLRANGNHEKLQILITLKKLIHIN